MLARQKVSGAFLHFSYQSIVRSSSLNKCTRDIVQRTVDGHRRSYGWSGVRRYQSCAGTVIATKESISSVDLVESVGPLATEALPRDGSKLNLTLLLSDRYAKLALDDSLPGKLLSRLLGERHARGHKFESITAVVDHVPTADCDDETGEGMSFIVQDVNDADLLSGSIPLRGNAQRAGSMSFALRANNGREHSDWKFQLPLAQTVFSTGLTSTLIYRIHDTSSSKVSSNARQLESIEIPISSHRPQTSLSPILPMIPLTTCRSIWNAMGNIVRTVSPLNWSPASNDTKEEPASQGLEKAVTAYFETRMLNPAPVSVWALIVPRQLFTQGFAEESPKALLSLNDHVLAQIWTTSQTTQQAIQQYSQLLLGLLPRGGRLVKVLSGGGGWGKKAGLLSIDPDLEYSTRELRDDQGWDFNFEDSSSTDDMSSSMTSKLDQALGNCVNEGDGIMFFIGLDQHQQDISLPASSSVDEGQTTIVLGASHPSDYNQLEHASRGSSTHNTAGLYLPGQFGMYSESGLATKVYRYGRLLSKSKLEIPGARIISRLN